MLRCVPSPNDFPGNMCGVHRSALPQGEGGLAIQRFPLCVGVIPAKQRVRAVRAGTHGAAVSVGPGSALAAPSGMTVLGLLTRPELNML